MLNFCNFIQVYLFTTNHHLKVYFAANPSFTSILACFKMIGIVTHALTTTSIYPPIFLICVIFLLNYKSYDMLKKNVHEAVLHFSFLYFINAALLYR